MSTNTPATNNTFGQLAMSPLVALGLSDATPTRTHIFGGLIWGAIGGWILGVMRGKAAPNSNILGL